MWAAARRLSCQVHQAQSDYVGDQFSRGRRNQSNRTEILVARERAFDHPDLPCTLRQGVFTIITPNCLRDVRCGRQNFLVSGPQAFSILCMRPLRDP